MSGGENKGPLPFLGKTIPFADGMTLRILDVPKPSGVFWYPRTVEVRYGTLVIIDHHESTRLPNAGERGGIGPVFMQNSRTGSSSSFDFKSALPDTDLKLVSYEKQDWPRKYRIDKCSDGERLLSVEVMSETITIHREMGCFLCPSDMSGTIEIGSLQDLMLLKMAYSI